MNRQVPACSGDEHEEKSDGLERYLQLCAGPKGSAGDLGLHERWRDPNECHAALLFPWKMDAALSAFYDGKVLSSVELDAAKIEALAMIRQQLDTALAGLS
jgi:hypothetical protein